MSNYNVEISADNTITVGLPSTGSGVAGPRGERGYSAYDLAVKNGYTGTEKEWLAYLKGDKGDKGDTGATGATGPAGANGKDGVNGADGKPGSNGLSAYELAVKNGFTGNESAWLESLKGEQGVPGPAGADGKNGVNGVDGKDGMSAYTIAVKNGYNGTESDWINKWVRGTIVSASTDSAGNMVLTDINGNSISTPLKPLVDAANMVKEAATSATASANSASAAKTSETNAASSKTAAETSANSAAASANAAATSAQAAANSAREQQADWAVTDTTSKAFIKNKPDVVTYKNCPYKHNAEWESNCVQSIAEGMATDHPDAYPYGVQVSLGDVNNGGNARIYFPHNGSMYVKTFWSASNTTGWRLILDDLNFSNFALSKDGTAVRAQGDAAGNIISSTYAKKSDLSSSVSTTSLTVTGATSVPTANEGNSSNTIASTAFVAKSIAKLVDSSPESLNTLNELATALGNDPNFATTVLNELGKKLNSAEAESTYAKKEDAGVLSGTVMAFSGTFENGYPLNKRTGLADKKWHLCDGTNGTPDLRQRFILGGDGTNSGTTGGSASVTLGIEHIPPHSHSGSTQSSGEHSHDASCSTNGDHHHGLACSAGWDGTVTAGYSGDSRRFTRQTDSAGSHSHTITVNPSGAHTHTITIGNTGGGQPHNNMPPYYVLAYIMKL